jgi:signal transduction histidine kinase
MTDSPDDAPPAVSARLAVAMARARDRRERWGERLRPVLMVLLASVAVASLRGTPSPGWTGTHLGVTIALLGCVLPMAAAAAERWPLDTEAQRAALALSIGGFGLALTALQQNGVSSLPASVSVMIAFFYLRTPLAAVIGGSVTAGLVVAILLQPGGTVLSAVTQLLFVAVLGITAVIMRQSAFNAERAELLLAQLEDAREAEAEAVALAERTRIAQDIHDVLAQSLSGLAIQLEAARRMARREDVNEDLRELLERSGKLVKEGLADARRAVGALRGDQSAALDRLPELVERYRCDLEMDATLTVSGSKRELSDEAGLALYRGAQEALTNAARYARGSQTLVTLSYEEKATVLTVEDRVTRPGAAAEPAVVSGGSGMGLTGMRERLAEVGGCATAGPTRQGWIVRMEVPA